MAYRHRKDIRDRANQEIDRSGVTMVSSVTKSKTSRSYHYNLQSNTQEDFDNLQIVNRSKRYMAQLDPLKRSMGQLTPSNVLTIKGYYDVKGIGVQNLRVKVYKYAKTLGINVETAFSQDKKALLVRIKRDWPVGVDISLG